MKCLFALSERSSVNPIALVKNTYSYMFTEIKQNIQDVEPSYAVLSLGRSIFVIKSLFVITHVRWLADSKLSVKPLNLFGLLNVYLLSGKYHINYKTLEDDVIYAVRQSSGRRKISVILG